MKINLKRINKYQNLQVWDDASRDRLQTHASATSQTLRSCQVPRGDAAAVGMTTSGPSLLFIVVFAYIYIYIYTHTHIHLVAIW